MNKPAGLAVHRSRLVGADDDYLMDRLRLQVEGRLHAVHRLDRATSGVLLVARSTEMAAELGRQLMARTVEKTYLAVVRGWPAEQGSIDYPLSGSSLRGEAKSALTHWRRLATVEVPIAQGRYPQQRYALLEVSPETGRYRQIRRHFHHVSHHLLGDTSHGRGDHNRLIRQHYGVHRLLLHARRLAVVHPATGQSLKLQAPLDDAWLRLLQAFAWMEMLDADAGEPTVMA
ncbi:pseudouridine synthase [Dokdonella soli]|uniref:tRNA pseudouridine synthase C n=1 Tax=Dokdonella soli TaxID=529810 RepID=A0ABN1IDI7_9GAMM